jgi:hypothetical protein
LTARSRIFGSGDASFCANCASTDILAADDRALEAALASFAFSILGLAFLGFLYFGLDMAMLKQKT